MISAKDHQLFPDMWSCVADFLPVLEADRLSTVVPLQKDYLKRRLHWAGDGEFDFVYDHRNLNVLTSSLLAKFPNKNKHCPWSYILSTFHTSDKLDGIQFILQSRITTEPQVRQWAERWAKNLLDEVHVDFSDQHYTDCQERCFHMISTSIIESQEDMAVCEWELLCCSAVRSKSIQSQKWLWWLLDSGRDGKFKGVAGDNYGNGVLSIMAQLAINIERDDKFELVLRRFSLPCNPAHYAPIISIACLQVCVLFFLLFVLFLFLFLFCLFSCVFLHCSFVCVFSSRLLILNRSKVGPIRDLLQLL